MAAATSRNRGGFYSKLKAPSQNGGSSPLFPPPCARARRRRSILTWITGSKSTRTAARHAKPSVHRVAAAVTGERLITTKTSTGKTSPYDCSRQAISAKKRSPETAPEWLSCLACAHPRLVSRPGSG